MCAAPAGLSVRIFTTRFSERVFRTSLNPSAIPDVTQITAAIRALRDTAVVVADRYMRDVESQQMRIAKLKITNTEIPQLAQGVNAQRLESLTAYPLARLCEWAPAPRKQSPLDRRDNCGGHRQN